jgi:DNA-binding response OmpR family regulator
MRVKCGLTRATRIESAGQQDHTFASMFFGERIKVLVVGDDPASLADLEVRLSREGFEVTGVVYAGEDSQVAVPSQWPDVILIYIRQEALRGVAVCEWLRAANPEPTIIMISDRASEEDEIWGLDAGADDYIKKPFSPKVLIARIRANVRGRRDAAGKRQVIEAGDLWMDLRNYVVRVKDELIDLRPQEFRILAILAQSSGEPLNREELIRRTPGQWQGNPNRTMIIHIHRLRSAIVTLSDYTYIHTVRKVGYRFEPVPKIPSSQFRQN